LLHGSRGRLRLTRSIAGYDKIHILRGGAVAQLGARLDGIEEVVGSNPISSTNLSNAAAIAPNHQSRSKWAFGEDATSPRTVFLSRLIGLYCILVALAMFSHKQATVEMVTALLHNATALFLVSLMAVIAGLAIVLGHNVWSGGALPVVVTLVGWAALVKGLLLLFLSTEAATRLSLEILGYEHLFYFYTSLSLLLGAFLTYGGFRSPSR
jgi:hypothetical protein